VRPTRRQLITATIAGLLLYVLAELWLQQLPFSSLSFGAFIGGFIFYVLALLALLLRERVVIAGTRVSISHTASFFRLREFDVSEVTRLRYRPPGFKEATQCLQVYLKPASHRSWNARVFANIQTLGRNGGIDTPLFVALVAAIRRVQPDLAVENLPVHYDGVLPRAQPHPDDDLWALTRPPAFPPRPPTAAAPSSADSATALGKRGKASRRGANGSGKSGGKRRE